MIAAVLVNQYEDSDTDKKDEKNYNPTDTFINLNEILQNNVFDNLNFVEVAEMNGIYDTDEFQIDFLSTSNEETNTYAVNQSQLTPPQ